MKRITFMISVLFCVAINVSGQIFEHLSVTQSDSLIQANIDNPDFVILDVRTAGEYNPSHLEGAINRNYYASDFNDMLAALNPNKTYLIHCGSGTRSGNAFNTMQTMDFIEVYNMLGGTSAWNTAGLPLTSAFGPLLMAVSDTIVHHDTVLIGFEDIIQVTITNRANDTLEFISVSNLSGTEFNTDFDVATKLLGSEDYSFNILYSPIDAVLDTLDFLIQSNGGNCTVRITQGKLIIQGSPCIVADFPFTGSAMDISGNDNHGTVTGATLAIDRFGNLNSAYNFDGVDDKITFSLAPNPTSITMVAWFNVQDSSMNQPFLSTNGAGGFSVNNGAVSLGMEIGFGDYGNQIQVPINSGQWYCSAITYDGSVVYYYLDGQIVHTTFDTDAIDYDGSGFFIGTSQSQSAFFGGLIDDVKIFDCALDSLEIENLYSEGLCFVTFTDTTIVYDTTIVTQYDTIITQVFDTITTEIFDTTFITETFYDTLLVSVDDTLIIQLFTSLNPLPTDTPDNNIVVYPNPASSVLYIELDQADLYTYSVVIRDNLGQIIFGDYNFTDNNQVDITAYTAGLYFIEITNNDTGYATIRKLVFE